MIHKLFRFREFLGNKVWRLFVQTIGIGILWFLVESGFAYVLQGFLSTIGLIPKVQLGWIAKLYPETVIGAISLLIAFGFVRSAVVYLRYHYSNITSQAFIRFQRFQVLKFSLENAQVTSMSESVSLFNERVAEGGKVIQNFVPIVNLSTSIILFSLLSLWITPIEFLLGMSILLIALLPIRRLNQVVGKASAGILSESRSVTHSLLVGLRNNFLLRIYGEVTPAVARGADSLRRYEEHFKKYSRVYCINGSFPHFVGVLAVAIVTLVSLKFLKTPSSSLLAFFYLFFRIAQSASETSALLNESRVYFSSFKTLMQFADRVRDYARNIRVNKGQHALLSIDRIDAEDLEFKWPGGARVFRGINASVVKGQILLIKGESGAGKSTLLSVLCGLLEPTSGKVFYNNKSLSDLEFSSVSSKIGYVGPESYLIEGTLRENLVFAHANPGLVTDENALAALALVHLDAELDRGSVTLDTHLNEFTQLSTGQKQRLSLARALLRNPQLLILDEATANLDGETESRIVDSLQLLRKGAIIIVVSHRNSFDLVADSKIVL